MAVGILQNHVSKHISKMYCLEPPMDPLAIKTKYFPDTEPSDSLSVCRSTGLTALFAPNAETKRRINTQLAQKAQADQTSAEPSTTVATDTATTSQPSTSAAPPRKSKKAKKRNTASAASTASTADTALTVDHPQVTMDSQLKEMLASMQSEMAEIRGKNERILNENERILNENERILNENGSMRSEIEGMRGENGGMRSEIENMRSEIERILNENESIRNENESINNDLTTVRKDLDAARVKHTQDVDALREVTMLLVPLHLRVLLDLARKKVLEHLGHESWEGLRASCSVHQLADTIFNDLKRKGVSYPPSQESIFFLCSYNNIRRAGNTAAHNAKEDDVRHAVLTQSLESQDRRCLESLFTYAYNGDQV
ncbi:hypothetical protein EV702DRAFT_1082730 [Suillus placidus]|uniref:Uncharacterized protein n=1 Tax=Suillus placidus TaxID=48579 RepID=A0A9P7A2B1_9AGAM|nr:hypothetical protein EV702DRAFT_1082730 [Suillus placidus]